MKEDDRKIGWLGPNGKLWLCLLLLALSVAIAGVCNPKRVMAAEWDSAYDYYSTYGGNAVFHATSDTDGGIYFGSYGNTSSSGIRYSTVGWKMVIENQSGTVLQTIYFALNGNYLKNVSKQYVNKYEYNLYSMSLSAVKARMNSEAIAALKAGKCVIYLDACMVIRKNGVAQGGMTDYGPAWGNVYTSYEGICGAAYWSPMSRASLQSYYGKTVSGLFYTVKVQAGPGISKTGGSGTYCYGTRISIKATPSTGYVFANWNGKKGYDENPYSFYVTGNSSWTANAKVKTTVVKFYRNRSDSDKGVKTVSYVYTGKNQRFPQTGWNKSGYHQLGWSETKSAAKATYSTTAKVSAKWINANYPGCALYAVWGENSYKIVYDGNGESLLPEMKISGKTLTYTGTITFPGTDMPTDFLGWGIKADGSGTLYRPGDTLSVAKAAKELGLLLSNKATIRFYAIWNDLPTIDAADQYYGLASLKDGSLTEEELASHAAAYDPQDGEIPYGRHETTGFYIKNYEAVTEVSAREFTEEEISQGFSLPLVFEACDSDGNKVQKEIRLHFADTAPYTEAEYYEQIRFISKEYLHGPAGLSEDSVWFKDPDHYALLRAAGLED